MELAQKIESIGGVEFTSDPQYLDEYDRIDFIEIYEIEEHQDFINFVDNYGGKSFKENVHCVGVNTVPHYPSGKIPFSTLLGFIEGAFGIVEIDELIEDNVPAGFIAFAMGDPTGDYWVYHKETKGIYFWQHDAPEDEDTFLVANSIHELILKCEIIEEDEN